MRLAAYARTSSEEQQLGLADQKQKLRQYCALYDHELVALVVGSESAKSLKRDEFQRVLRMLRDGIADGLLVLNVDRLCRDVADGQQLLREYFGENATFGKHLFSVQDYIDTRTATGRMIFNFKLVVAQWERETIAERTKAALAVKRRNGERCGEVPFGFTLGRDGTTLVRSPREQKAIALAKRLRKQGLSYARIAERFDALGVRPKKGGARWGAGSVMRVLKRCS